MLPSHGMFTAKNICTQKIYSFEAWWNHGQQKIGKGLPTETISLPWRVLNGMGDVLNNASDVRTWAYCIGWLAVWTFKRYKKREKGLKISFYGHYYSYGVVQQRIPASFSILRTIMGRILYIVRNLNYSCNQWCLICLCC